jgi:hypothetical protein
MKRLKPFYCYLDTLNPQIRDKEHNIILVLPTMGGQYATNQLRDEAAKRARKLVNLLNSLDSGRA